MDIEIFKEFPITQETEEEIEKNLPHFVFYSKHGKDTDCYCTACHSSYTDSQDNRVWQLQDNYKHNSYGLCTVCGEDVQFKAMHRGRKSYRYKHNFAVFHAVGNTVLIRCFTAEQYFDNGSMEPEFSLDEKVRYIIEPGKAVQYTYKFEPFPDQCRWIRNWAKKKTAPSEPVFGQEYFGYSDKTYTIIGDDCLKNTFLKYAVTGLEKPIETNFIAYLCRIAVKPNLEYLMKGGFRAIADSYVAGVRLGVRINWKSNNLLKMLKIDRTELKFLTKGNGSYYPDYVNFRRSIYKGKTSTETIDYFERFCGITTYLRKIHEKLGIGFKTAMDYISKQGNEIFHTVIAYCDYIGECEALRYDLSDRSVSMPRDLLTAHQRTSSIIKFEKNKQAAELFKKSDMKRQSFPYTDSVRGLKIVLPESVDEIVAEGRVLSHCVGGYADRHAEGKLHILFLRKISEPDVPYYTMEVDTMGKIIQCRGYKNNVERNGGEPKPQGVIDFENEYQAYLDTVFGKKKGMKSA